jgi:hypothetical protein
MDGQTMDRRMMTRCIELSKSSGESGEYPCAAVICRDGKRVAESMNRVSHEREVTRQPMIDYAASRQPPDTRIKWRQADALALPFENAARSVPSRSFSSTALARSSNRWRPADWNSSYLCL